MNTQEFYKHIDAIHEATREIVPDPAWVLRTRQTLVMQVSNSMPPVKVSWKQRAYDVANSFLPMNALMTMRRSVIGFLSVIGVVAGASIASVSAAERSIPGDLLYPVKLATEQTRLILTQSKTDKLKLKTEFVGRRAQEIQAIAKSDNPQKQQQIKQAAETLRQDLDTVNIQLDEVSRQESPVAAAQAAKLVDQQSSELAQTLKDIKVSTSDEVRLKVAEAEAAAVNTGTQAVQVLIDTQQDPQAQQVVSGDELRQSINTKVQGLEQNITDAAQLITGSSTLTTVASSSLGIVPGSSTSSENSPSALVLTAHQSLEQAKQLLQENKLGEVKTQLQQTVKDIVTMEASVAAVSSTENGLPITPTNATTSDASVQAAATSSATTTATTSTPSTTTQIK